MTHMTHANALRRAAIAAITNVAGMGNVNAAAEVGGFLNYSINRAFVLTSSSRYGTGVDRNGVLLDLGAVYSTEVAPRWRMGLGAATTYANASGRVRRVLGRSIAVGNAKDSPLTREASSMGLIAAVTYSF